MLVTFPVTTLPAGITAWSKAYIVSVIFPETTCPTAAMRTFWSTATRRAVPAGTCNRITESGTDGAIVSEVGGAQRDGSASSRGTSLQPPRTIVCAGSATGTARKTRKGKKRRRSLNILRFLLERLYVAGLRGPPGCLGNLPRRRVFRQPRFPLRLGLGLGGIFGQD